MSHIDVERESKQNHEVFHSDGPKSEAGIASSIANMLASNRDRTFEIWEGETAIALRFEGGVLAADSPSSRATFWLDRIVNFLQHPIHRQYFRSGSDSITVQVVRDTAQTVSIPLLVQAERVR